MKVLLTKPFFEEDISYLKDKLNKEIELIIPEAYSEEGLITYAKDADVLMGGLLTEKLIDSAKKLAFIQIPWTGVDNLDFDLLRRKKVTLCNSHSNATIVAEHAVALMMDAAKKISYHDHQMRVGHWNRVNKQNPNEISPFSGVISNSKVCIIGYGAIGQKIHQLLTGYQCEITAVTRDQATICSSKGFKLVSDQNLHDTIRNQQFVFVTLPLTPDTKGMVNKKFLESMGTDSILINISRGEVLDEEALFNALLSKELSFAAIDTWFNYPTKDKPDIFPSLKFEFHKLNNLVLSPHRAGYATGGFPHLDDAIENLNRFHDGSPLINVVDLEKKY